MKFEEYHFSSDIKKNLLSLGFIRPTDIQYKSIPPILRGEDVLAIAQTGTGKTAAFVIPIIDKIHSYKTSRRSTGIKCIVLEPTRELAIQVGKVFNSIANHTKVKIFSLYGGVEQDRQIETLQDGIDVLISTPGRMFDLISQGFIRLQGVSILVLDEADHMLDLGFIEDIKFIKKMLPGRHQTLFFSATIGPEIKKLAFSQVNSDAIRIQISPIDPVAKNVSHYVMAVQMDDKRFFLQRFVQDHPESKIIVFVRTRVRAERVAKSLERAGLSSLTIHGEKNQSERTAVMASFTTASTGVLIATDISARGIDVPDVHFVINYDLPEKAENYVHRVGRTGRGVKKGSAISFCSIEEKPLLKEIEALINKDIETIEIDKGDYFFTVQSRKCDKTPEMLIAEYEQIVGEKKKKKRAQRARKKK